MARQNQRLLRTVDLLEGIYRGGLDDIEDGYNLFENISPRSPTMSDTHIFADTSLGEEFEELELTESAKAEHGVLEGRDLLDRDLAPTGPMDSGTDDAICTLADDVEDLVLGADVEADLPGCWGSGGGGLLSGSRVRHGGNRQRTEGRQGPSGICKGHCFRNNKTRGWNIGCYLALAMAISLRSLILG